MLGRVSALSVVHGTRPFLILAFGLCLQARSMKAGLTVPQAEGSLREKSGHGTGPCAEAMVHHVLKTTNMQVRGLQRVIRNYMR
jgi:hypothetical protein